MTWLRLMCLAALAGQLVGSGTAADPAAANPDGARGSGTLPPVLRTSEPPDSVLITLPRPPPPSPPPQDAPPRPPPPPPPLPRDPGPVPRPPPASPPAGPGYRPGQAVSQPRNRARGSRLLPKAHRTLEGGRRPQTAWRTQPSPPGLRRE